MLVVVLAAVVWLSVRCRATRWPYFFSGLFRKGTDVYQALSICRRNDVYTSDACHTPRAKYVSNVWEEVYQLVSLSFPLLQFGRRKEARLTRMGRDNEDEYPTCWSARLGSSPVEDLETVVTRVLDLRAVVSSVTLSRKAIAMLYGKSPSQEVLEEQAEANTRKQRLVTSSIAEIARRFPTWGRGGLQSMARAISAAEDRELRRTGVNVCIAMEMYLSTCLTRSIYLSI